MLDQVGYESNVTWDEPKQTFTEPSINNTPIVERFWELERSWFRGCCWNRLRRNSNSGENFLPNKIFDREKQIILQLGIGSKPIKAKDFSYWLT